MCKRVELHNNQKSPFAPVKYFCLYSDKAFEKRSQIKDFNILNNKYEIGKEDFTSQNNRSQIRITGEKSISRSSKMKQKSQTHPTARELSKNSVFRSREIFADRYFESILRTSNLIYQLIVKARFADVRYDGTHPTLEN